MPSTTMKFIEADVVKLILEFLQNRTLSISMLSLEREAGIINGGYSDDLLFLRQLILDGQWDDVMDFVQPLSAMPGFNLRQFQYLIYKHKYLELLCIKSESGPLQDYDMTVEELVKCVNTLEQLCPNKEEYSNLCLLLTLPKLSDHASYQDWNPSNARVECFKDVLPLLEKHLPVDKKSQKSDKYGLAKDDRLVQLLIKGILYESCVEYCQHKATSTELDSKDLKLSAVLNGTGFSDADLSLLSWLQAIPHETFACPFEQKSLGVDVRPLEKPSLEASWSEQILVTPIKPKMFPHSAVASLRPRSAELMSRSLAPQYDGLAHGLAIGRRDNVMATSGDSIGAGLMSRSFAGFHLNTPVKKNLMHTSIDKLFEVGDNILNTHSSSIILESSEELPGTPPSSPPEGGPATSTPRAPIRSKSPQQSVAVSGSQPASLGDSSTDLYREYQKQRQRLQEEMEQQEQRRRIYQQQLQSLDQQQLQTLDQQQPLAQDDNRFIDSQSNTKNLDSVLEGKSVNDKHKHISKDCELPVKASPTREKKSPLRGSNGHTPPGGGSRTASHIDVSPSNQTSIRKENEVCRISSAGKMVLGVPWQRNPRASSSLLRQQDPTNMTQ